MQTPIQRFNAAIQEFDEATEFRHDRCEAWQAITISEFCAEHDTSIVGAARWFRIALVIRDSEREIKRAAKLAAVRPLTCSLDDGTPMQIEPRPHKNVRTAPGAF